MGCRVSDALSGMADWSHADLVAFLVKLSERLAVVEAENADLRAQNTVLRSENAALRAEIAALKSKNSGNSGLPSSRDPAAERQRQAVQRRGRGRIGTENPVKADLLSRGGACRVFVG